MRLVVEVGGASLEFTEPRSGGAYPWLVARGDLSMRARAGHIEGIGANEAPSLPAELDNANGQAVAVLGRPLRAAATMYDDDDEILLAGLIAAVEYGRALGLTIEA